MKVQFDGEAACQAMFAGGPVALAYSRFDAATREEVHVEFLVSVEPYREGDTWNIPGEFVYAVGRRQQEAWAKPPASEY